MIQIKRDEIIMLVVALIILIAAVFFVSFIAGEGAQNLAQLEKANQRIAQLENEQTQCTNILMRLTIDDLKEIAVIMAKPQNVVISKEGEEALNRAMEIWNNINN